MPEPTLPLTVVPANRAACEDLQAIFGARGQGHRCQCQRYKLKPREAFRNFPVEERAFRPHITLARRRPQAPPGQPAAWPPATPPRAPDIPLHSLTLFESRLSPSGARYTPLAHFPFAQR
jgi:2'-5' RNA ligase